MKTIQFYVCAPIVFPIILLGTMALEVGIKLTTIYRWVKTRNWRRYNES